MSKMNLERAKTLAVSLHGYVDNSVVESSVDIEVIDKGENSAIKVKPAMENKSGSLFHCAEITDFCRGNHLDFWIGAEDSCGCPVPYFYIF